MIKLGKFISRLLRDKDDFHKDDELRSNIELHNYLLQQIIELEQYIIPAKLKYFWRNKKSFLLKLFGKLMLWIFIVAVFAFAAWFFGFKVTPPPPKAKHFVTLYVTENTDTNYIKKCIPNVNFTILYPPDPEKDWRKYKEMLHSKFETKGTTDSVSYRTRNANGEYWGRYQMGSTARKACGLGDMSWEEFSSNPEIQEGAFKTWIRKIYNDMMPYIAKYEGRFIGGYQITASGIVSMAHNQGEAAAIAFLQTGSTKASTRFMSLGGYNLTSILK